MSAAVAPGTIVGGFRVASPLGEGATGHVYLAERIEDGRLVALKVLAPQVAQDERFRRRFLRESQLIASLDHPHIVPNLASGEDDGHLYIAMAYVEGSDLRRLLHREGRLDPERALDLISQAAEALDAAHAADLVHRDVKPGNILVAVERNHEHAYVCDFGLARHVSSVSSLTSDRGFVGTIDYVPPEQIEGGTIDGRADVYSLGCVLYECLAGERPFERETELSVLFAHLNERPPPITDYRPELPAAFDAVFATALAKSPAERYSSCGELADAARAAGRGKVVRRPRRRRRAAIAVVALAVTGGAAAAGLLLASGSGAGQARTAGGATLAVAPNAVTLVSARARRAVKTLPFRTAPSDMALGPRFAWIVVPDQQVVARLDRRTGTVDGRVTLPFAPDRIVGDGRAAWVTESSGSRIARIGARRDGKLRVLRVLSVATIGPRVSSPAGIAVGGGSLWVARGAHLARVNPRTGHVIRLFATPVTSNWVVSAEGSIWAASAEDGLILKIDPIANRVEARHKLRGWISDLAVGHGYVWAPVVPDGVVYKLSVDDLSEQGEIAAGHDPESVSVGAGALWIANTSGRALTRVDLAGGPRRTFRLPADPTSARYRDGAVWTATAPAPPTLAPTRSGQEIRIPLSRSDMGSLDPAALANADRFPREYATCATLLNYPDSAGASGLKLQPEVAAAMPAISAGGRTYTFRVRPGFRFSPPSGQPVTAATFRYSLERALSPVYGRASPGMSLLRDIVGAAAYNAGKARHVRGIAVTGSKLSITLQKPAGDFETRISQSYFCPVPIGTPAVAGGLTRPIPSAGPYYVDSSVSGQTVLLRNPNYRGKRPRHIERIVYTVGTPTAKAIALLDAGAADYIDGYASDADPTALASDSLAARRWGPSSAAAREGRQRYFVIPVPGTDMIALNARRPLFRDARMRRAVNFAIDRRALAAVYDEQPVDQYIPPGVPGSRPAHVYPLEGPNLRVARRLAGSGHRTAVLYACGPPTNEGVAQLVRAELARIGIAVRIEQSLGCLNGPEPAKVVAADMQLISVLDSVRDPGIWVKATLGSPYIAPGYWNDPVLRRRIAAADKLRGPARVAAFASLDQTLVRNEAPFAAYGGFTTAEYFAPRVGCKIFQATYRFVDLGALCVRSR